MPTRPVGFRQSDVTRALKGAEAAGLPVARVEIDADGRIVIVAGEPATGSNALDPYEAWREKRDARRAERRP